MLSPPSEENYFHCAHVALLRQSFWRLTGTELVDGSLSPSAAAQTLWQAPFVVVSHTSAADPVFNYGNGAALGLFEMSWREFTTLPSRLSAEAPKREERQRLLDSVARQGFASGYSGVRIAKSGRRFVIEDVTVWNLIDEQGRYHGQGATYSHWRYLDQKPPQPLA